jgi:hypothetical protein
VCWLNGNANRLDRYYSTSHRQIGVAWSIAPAASSIRMARTDICGSTMTNLAQFQLPTNDLERQQGAWLLYLAHFGPCVAESEPQCQLQFPPPT